MSCERMASYRRRRLLQQMQDEARRDMRRRQRLEQEDIYRQIAEAAVLAHEPLSEEAPAPDSPASRTH